jgi:ATP-binding cassette subfamily F protein uup
VAPPAALAPAPQRAPAGQAPERAAPARGGLSFTERHRLDALPGVIERIEAEIGKLAAALGEPDLYARDPVRFARVSEALADRQRRLAEAEEEWLRLAERAEA